MSSRTQGDIAIRAEGVGKLYRLGARASYETLRDTLANGVQAAIRTLTLSRRAPEERATLWALKDLDLEVKVGEVVGLIGRNGAGKSTFLKILSRITDPTTGRIEMRGRVGSLLEVGTGFHPELTGRENIYLNGAILGMRKAEVARRFDEIVSFAEVERFVDTPVKHYSTGMYVRLAFSVAACLESEILLVDEVLAVGDVSFQQKCLGRMGAIQHEGRTIVFVSHNMSAIRRLCSKCVVIDRGRVGYVGSVESAIERYLDDHAVGADSPFIDAEALPRENPAFGQDLRIVSVRLHTGSRQATIPFGEPLLVTLTFDVRRFIRDVSWTASIENAEGLRIIDCVSVQWLSPISMEPGRWSVTGTLDPNPLRPGTYRMSIGFGSHGLRALDVLSYPLKFTVENDADIPQTWEVSAPTVIRLRTQWSKPEPIPRNE